MRKIFILVKIIVFSILLGVIAYQQYRYKWLENSWWCLEKERDSLCYLDYLRRNEHLPEYYLLSKDSILKLLPRPTSDKIWIFAGKKKELDSYNWPARHIVDKFKKNDTDTIIMNAVFWRLPYNRLPDLYIGFIKDSMGQWIAAECVQWDNGITKID